MGEKFELTNDELWDRAGMPGGITRDELGIQKSPSDENGYQDINEGVNISLSNSLRYVLEKILIF